MKSYDTSFGNFNGQNVGFRPSCLLITRKDGYQVGLTDFDKPLTFAGVTYQPAGGFTPSDTDLNLGTTANQITVTSFFSSYITETDVWKGLYLNAAVRVFRVNPHSLPTDLNASPYQYEPLVNGRIATVRLTDQTYLFECRGIQQLLDTQQGSVTSKLCRNDFGDSVCGYSVPNDPHEIIRADNLYQFALTHSVRDNLYTGGSLTWDSGNNAGKTNFIVYSAGDIIRLLEPTDGFTVGDWAYLKPGCDKTFGTCVQRWGNGINFRGEPGLPGTDEINKDGTVSDG